METVGRRSGRPWVTPMGYVRESADSVLVVAEHGRKADWVRNALAA
ncbi:MAG: nitroreductase/quinone reductase family protein, partial [Actinomycetota bacterium]